MRWNYDWQVDTWQNSSSPAIAGGAVYHAFDTYVSNSWGGYNVGYITAFDAATGKLKWSKEFDCTVDSSPAVALGIVYVNTSCRNTSGNASSMNAYDATSGILLWSRPNQGIRSSPALANGVVYFGSTDMNLYGLNASSGHLEWSFDVGNQVRSSPAIANGAVFVGADGGIGSDNGMLHAFDSEPTPTPTVTASPSPSPTSSPTPTKTPVPGQASPTPAPRAYLPISAKSLSGGGW